jgi:hypothetical protein
MTVVCHTLGMSRRTGYYIRRERPTGRYQRADDAMVLQQIHAVTNSRATYGYRRVWAMVNRAFRTGYNRKRIRRVMQLHGLMLPPRVHRRHGRPHLGQIQRPASSRSLNRALISTADLPEYPCLGAGDPAHCIALGTPRRSRGTSADQAFAPQLIHIWLEQVDVWPPRLRLAVEGVLEGVLVGDVLHVPCERTTRHDLSGAICIPAKLR